MNKTIKNLLILALIGLVIGGGVVYYVFNMPHRDIEGEKASFKIEASTLFTEYSNNEEAGNKKYGDKVIQVTGKIVEIAKEGNEISFVLNDEMEGVNCSLDSVMIINNVDMANKYIIGDNITLKGKCDGFDMIMGVVLTQCFIVK
jgi:hypothetical protein